MQNYKIIDNFLNQEHFKKLCELNLELVNSDNIKVYHNIIWLILSNMKVQS